MGRGHTDSYPSGTTRTPPLNESAGYVTEHAANGNKEPTKVTAEPRVSGYGSTEAVEGSPLQRRTHWPPLGKS